MNQIIIAGASSNSLNNAATEYNTICGGTSWYADEFNALQLAAAAGSMLDLLVELDGTPGDSKTWTFTLMKNGVARTVNGVLKQKYECNKCGKKFRITISSIITNEA